MPATLAGNRRAAGISCCSTFVPLLFLPLRSRMLWLAVAPLAEVLLSRMPTTFTMGTHYAGAWIGYVLVAFAFAAARTLQPRGARFALFGLHRALLGSSLRSPIRCTRGSICAQSQPRDVALDRFLTTLPADASVATQEEAYTHLALLDPYARLLPESSQSETRACFVLIDRDFPDSARLQEYGDALARLVRDRRYVEVGRTGGIELYRRADRCR